MIAMRISEPEPAFSLQEGPPAQRVPAPASELDTTHSTRVLRAHKAAIAILHLVAQLLAQRHAEDPQDKLLDMYDIFVSCTVRCNPHDRHSIPL